MPRVPTGRTDRATTERKPREERWPELLKTAAQVFHEQGYDATSVQHIADRLGMLKGSLYYYINTKEDLLYEVIRDVFARGRGNVMALSELPGNPIQRLHGVIAGQIVYMAENLTETAVFLHEMQALAADRQRQILGDEHAYMSAFVELVEEGQREGLVRPELDPSLAALSILGSMNWFYRWFRPQGGYSAEQVGRHFADMNVRGIASAAGVLTLPPLPPATKRRKRAAR